MSVDLAKSEQQSGKTVAAKIAYRLRCDIVACKIKPGESLKFDGLRQLYGASFTTLREALTALTGEGLVVAEEQRGFRVAPVSLEDLSDLTDVRLLVEAEAIRKSILNGNDDWEINVMSALHRMCRIEERIKGNPVVDPLWKTAHRDFHTALISACNSPILMALHGALFDRAERYRNLSAALRPWRRDKMGEHRALMQAALARNANLTVRLIESHIRSTANNVAKYAKHHLTTR